MKTFNHVVISMVTRMQLGGIMDGGEKNNKVVDLLHLAKLFTHKPTQGNDPKWPPIK
jgi:hypothetical protein